MSYTCTVNHVMYLLRQPLPVIHPSPNSNSSIWMILLYVCLLHINESSQIELLTIQVSV
uniref:Uncharacterized protein n=1 Tax=Anguilla anguilla TaxID=7936 RepID=A0A0E9U1B3_ANGAN